MLCVTTPAIDGKTVVSYRGVIAAEVIFGADMFRDLFAAYRDAVGGRSRAYEKEFEKARALALEILIEKAEALRADAILAIRFDYQVLGQGNGMMMVAVTGTAVQLAKSAEEQARDEERELDEKAMFFVEIGSSEKGPFSLDQLKELAGSGRIAEEAKVRVEGREGSRQLADLHYRR